MIDSGTGGANSGTGSPSADNQQLKKTALRDLQNDNRIMEPKFPGNPPLKDKSTEAITVSGIKRSATDCPQGSVANQSPVSNGVNGHLVYARRKCEQDLPKSNNCGKDKPSNSAQDVQREQETSQRQAQSEPTKKPCVSAFTPASVTSPMTTSGGPSPFLVKPPNGPLSGEPNPGTNNSGIPHFGNLQGTNDQHWKERFLRLQQRLRLCEQSSHQDYVMLLQGLSPVARSKHAVELEKRAIQLLLEEGHELMRMKHLNVLGKTVPMNSISPLASQLQSLQTDK